MLFNYINLSFAQLKLKWFCFLVILKAYFWLSSKIFTSRFHTFLKECGLDICLFLYYFRAMQAFLTVDDVKTPSNQLLFWHPRKLLNLAVKYTCIHLAFSDASTNWNSAINLNSSYKSLAELYYLKPQALYSSHTPLPEFPIGK